MMQKFKKYLYKLLKKSEKLAKTDMVYLANGGSWLVTGHVLTSVAGVVLAIGFAHLLPKDVYGNYKFILSLAAIIGSLTLTGMGTAITQAVARGYDGELKVGFTKQLRWSVFILFASLVGSTYYIFNDNYIIGLSLIIVGLCTPIITSASLYRAFLDGKKDFKRGTIYSTTQNIVPVFVLLITAVFTQNVILLIFATFATRALVSLWAHFKIVATYSIKSSLVDDSTVTFAKHLSFLNILGVIAAQIDKIIVFHFLGAAELAIYAFAVLIPAQIDSLLKKINQLAFPKFAAQKKELVKKTLYTKTLRLVTFSALLSGSYILAAPFIFNLLFPQYLESIIYTQLYSLNVILTGGVLLVATYFQTHKLVLENSISTIFHTILKIVLMLTLVMKFGLLGIILAILIARAAMIALNYLLLRYN